MDFRNSTACDSVRLHALFAWHARRWRTDGLVTRVRFSRGAPFSGTCYYRDSLIYVNIGRENPYPFRFAISAAPTERHSRGWRRPLLYLTVPDAERLALFVFLHELYHWLAFRVGRSPRWKEALCDRFATLALVDDHNCKLTDAKGGVVSREAWDIGDPVGLLLRGPQSGAVVA
ncbi:MAG: hypothetical protein KDA32_02335 [Phycisphaerales bacterium]|nr:hypothetical protein [Phycisphaerales bacterium]